MYPKTFTLQSTMLPGKITTQKVKRKLVLTFYWVSLSFFWATDTPHSPYIPANGGVYCIGHENKITEEAGTTEFLGLQIDNKCNGKTQNKYSILYYKDSHITHKNKYFNITFLCLFAVHQE
jgi:hypothetical protein